jgi:hypothetical protein
MQNDDNDLPQLNVANVVNDAEASFFTLLTATLTFPLLAIFLWTAIILRTIVAAISVGLALTKLLKLWLSLVIRNHHKH